MKDDRVILPPFLEEAFDESDRAESDRAGLDRAGLESVELARGDAEQWVAGMERGPSAGEAFVRTLGGELLRKVAEPPLRYAPFFERVSELLQVDQAAVESLLAPSGFKRAPLPGVRFKEVPGAQVPTGSAASIVRIAAGTRYPRHRHRYAETLLLLEGGYEDDTGQRYVAGDLHHMTPGSEHAFVVDPGGPCVAVAVADQRLQFVHPALRLLARIMGR